MNEDRALRYSARIVWSEEDGAFVATSPEFEGISALGSTASDAASELQLALQLAVEAHEAEGWPVPEPLQEPHYSGQFRLRLPRSLHAWLADRAGLEGVSLNTLVLEILSRARGKQADPAERHPSREGTGAGRVRLDGGEDHNTTLGCSGSPRKRGGSAPLSGSGV